MSLSAIGAFADSMDTRLPLDLTSVALVLLREMVLAANFADREVAASGSGMAKSLTLFALS